MREQKEIAKKKKAIKKKIVKVVNSKKKKKNPLKPFFPTEYQMTLAFKFMLHALQLIRRTFKI